MNRKSRIAVFASGNGTNAEAIFRFFNGHPSIEVVWLLSNNPRAYALERATSVGIPTSVFTPEQLENGEVLSWLEEKQVTHIALAGFLWLIPANLLQAFPGRIINIHPALLPKYGGKGMYGAKIHAAVRAAGERETGITIHVVNEHYDRGDILFQATCDINPDETPEEIAARVNKLEYLHYPAVIRDWILQTETLN